MPIGIASASKIEIQFNNENKAKDAEKKKLSTQKP